MIVALLAGIIIGLVLGALGGGGSILAVPVLVYALHQSAHAATTESLVVVGTTALVATLGHHRRGNVRWGQGLLFGVLGAAGTWAGGLISQHIAPTLLLESFAALLVVVAVLMWRKSMPRRGPVSTTHQPITWTPRRIVRLLLTASGVGLLVGFFGVGGGFAVVPALVLALDTPMTVAVGTSLLVIAVNSATALVSRLGGGATMDWGVVAPFTIAAALASLAGGHVASRLPYRILTRAFAAILLLVAVYMLVRSLG